MFSFIEDLSRSAWNTSAACYQNIASIIENQWIIVGIGVVLIVVAFIIARIKTDDEDSLQVFSLPTDGGSIAGISLMFIVQYFNDFQSWDAVNGFAGLFAWLGVLFFLLWISGILILLGMNIVLFFRFMFNGLCNRDFLWGFKTGLKFMLVNSLQMIGSMVPLLLGLLLVSSVTGPILAAVFFIAALFWPTSDKIGEFKDRNGNWWEVRKG